MSTFKCNVCEKNFKSSMALNGHKRIHGPSKGKSIVNENNASSLKKQLAIEKYLENPNRCLNCNGILPYQSRKKFCNRSCSATFNNKKRDASIYRRQAETIKRKFPKKGKIKVENTIPKKSSKPRTTQKFTVKKDKTYPQSKIFIINCQHCSSKQYKRRKMKYCDQCSYLYKSENRNRYKFTFNVYHYPELFDISLIDKHGWFSHGGRKNYNPNGITRDHKVSINDAIKNDYDPFYITHVLNCELMPFDKNNKKKSKSSISYEELVRLVDAYEFKLALSPGIEPGL